MPFSYIDWAYEIQTATLKNVISDREFGPSNVTSDVEFGSTFQVMQISRICKKTKKQKKTVINFTKVSQIDQ